MLLNVVRRVIVVLCTRHLAGPKTALAGPEQLIVVCTVRNGAALVEPFVAHYRALGAAQIVLLDNGSQDETLTLARAHPDVTLLSCRLPFRPFRAELKRYLVRRFGRGRWTLCVDIDELFDYPRSGALALHDLLAYLRHYGYNAVVCQMLDMFSTPGSTTTGSTLRERYPLAELDNIKPERYELHYGLVNQVTNPAIMILHGGIRKALFGTNVYLSKHPLIFLEPPLKPFVPDVHDVRGAKLADLSCVLYHYKLIEGFEAKVRQAVIEENYYNRSIEYKRYLEVLEREGELRVTSPGAWPVRDTNELVERGFLNVSAAYEQWVKQHGTTPTQRGAQ